MELFQVVKKNDEEFLHLEDIKGYHFAAQCFEDDSVVADYLKNVDTTIENDNQFLKQRFNPLLVKQNLFLVSDDTYSIPYLLLKHRENMAVICAATEQLSAQKNYIVHNLINYLVSKDFAFLYNIFRYDFPVKVLNILNEAVTIHGLDLIKLGEAVNLLDEVPVCCSSTFRTSSCAETAILNIAVKIQNNRGSRKKKKNVIFLHLESISTEILYNNLQHIPNLYELMNNSYNLRKFYSTASSTSMAQTDLFYGNDFETVSIDLFKNFKIENPHSKHLFQIFSENGYKTFGLGYGDFVGDEINSLNLWDHGQGKYRWGETFDDFLDSICMIAKSPKPFAAHIWNSVTHIGVEDEDTQKSCDFVEKMKVVYASLDITIQRIIDILRKQDLLQDTIIIGYGDHGDDKWTRALNSGLTHVIEPYINVIRTPAFIYDAEIGKGECDEIVSIVDLKRTALYLAGIDYEDNFPHKGINIFQNTNQHVFSRSLFTNQLTEETIKAEWVRRLNHFSGMAKRVKSFSVINKNYNLLVSDNGVEFFIHSLDPHNYNNLLDFFAQDCNGKIVGFNHHGAWEVDFRSVFFNNGQLFDIIKNYEELKTALREHISLKNAMIEGEKQHPFDLSAFSRTRKRGFLWN